jgi:hypothetical protein
LVVDFWWTNWQTQILNDRGPADMLAPFCFSASSRDGLDKFDSGIFVSGKILSTARLERFAVEYEYPQQPSLLKYHIMHTN